MSQVLLYEQSHQADQSARPPIDGEIYRTKPNGVEFSIATSAHSALYAVDQPRMFRSGRTRENIFIENTERLLTMWPRIGEIFDAQPGISMLLPYAETMNDFGANYLEPIGATNLRLVQGTGGKYDAVDRQNQFAAGEYHYGNNPPFFMHDALDHGLPVRALHRKSTDVFQDIAQLGQSMRASDPESAKGLAEAQSRAIDLSANTEMMLNDGPRHLYLLTALIFQPSITRAILEAIEAHISAPPARPAGSGEIALGRITWHPELQELKMPNIEGWLDWEKTYIPIHKAAIDNVLKKDPDPQKVALLRAEFSARRDKQLSSVLGSWLGMKAVRRPVSH